MPFGCYNSCLEVNLRALAENLESIGKTAGDSVTLIPVLKGNAYGLGVVTVANAIVEQIRPELIAVSQVGEALELINSGVTGPRYMTLSGIPACAIAPAVENDVQPTVYNLEIARALTEEVKRQGKPPGYPIHLKIETGLNRIGVKPGEELEILIKELKSTGLLRVESIFSHFIDGENPDSTLAPKQFLRFNQAVEQLKSLGIDTPMRHMCNSGAFEWYSDAFCDAVRIGRRLYMDAPSATPPADRYRAIKEVCSWRSRVVNLRMVRAGESVGYDEKFKATGSTRVAVVCVGYGDGLYSALADVRAPVLVGENRAVLIGVCMDQCFLDVTDVPCEIGDEVTFFGYSSSGAFLSAQQVASLVNHEGVYFTSQLSNRVQRSYTGSIIS